MRHLFLFLILFSPILSFGQEIENDLSVKSYALPDSLGRNLAGFNVSDSLSNYNKYLSVNGLPKTISYFDSLIYLRPLHHAEDVIPSGKAIIPLWRNARFIATGDVKVMPGLMQIHSGTIGINQNIGKVSLYMGALANKYGYFNGLHTQYGLFGNIQYFISPKLSFTAFGTYYWGTPPLMANGMPMPPSMIGYFGVSTFGGYMSYQFNETFGVDVGAQTVQQFGTKKYELEPIVTPTVKVGKVKIGLPVGQILHGIIRSQAERHNRR